MCFQSDSIKTSRELFQTDVLACGCLWRCKVRTFVRCILFCMLIFPSEERLPMSERKNNWLEIILCPKSILIIRSIFYILKGITAGDLVIGFRSFWEELEDLGQSWAPVTQILCIPCICVANNLPWFVFECSDSCRRTHDECQQLFSKPLLLFILPR